VIPLSDRVLGRAFGPSRSHVDDGGGLQYVSRKIDWVFRFFPSRGIYRRKGGVRRWTRAAHPWWHGRGLGRAALGCVRPLAPLRLVSGKIGGSAFVSSNSENISCVASKTQKQQKTGN
jgi:hypothetical protein